MKRKFVLGLTLVFMLTSCAWFQSQTIQTRTETMVVSFETIAFVAFPMAKAFIVEKGDNGQWTGDKLRNAKKTYNLAVDKFSLIIDASSGVIAGTASPLTNLPAILIEVSKLLADATGGTVDTKARTLTLPKTGGAK